MSQPKLPPDLAGNIAALGFVVSCYQPVSLFKKLPARTLPNIARDDDPWQVFLRRPDEIGVVVVAYGETLRDALEDAIRLRPGVISSVRRLAVALGDLTETMRCL